MNVYFKHCIFRLVFIGPPCTVSIKLKISSSNKFIILSVAIFRIFLIPFREFRTKINIHLFGQILTLQSLIYCTDLRKETKKANFILDRRSECATAHSPS